MAHNPPRQWFTEKDAQRLAKDIVTKLRRSAQGWRDLKELAEYMARLADLGQHVRLTPRTAAIVARQLTAAAKKPTRNAIALMICRRGEANRCETPCYECTGKANIVVDAYGSGDDKPD